MVYCEENLCAWIRQPANTWTNLAAIVVGIVIFFHYVMTGKRGSSWLVGLCGVCVGITSFLYHASFSFFFQVFDLASMFLLSAFLLAANLTRLTGRTRLFYPLFFIIFIATTGVLLLVRGQSGAILFVSELAVSIGMEIGLHQKGKKAPAYRWYFFALGAFGAALAVWILDFSRIWCVSSHHLINGHALWHVISAAALFFIYLFYRAGER